MLTLKHIIWNGDFETIYEVKQVRVRHFDRTPDAIPGSKTAIEFIAFDLFNDEVMTLTFGKVYVMNEHGKTIASYEIAGGAEPANARGSEYKPLASYARPGVGQLNVKDGASLGNAKTWTAWTAGEPTYTGTVQGAVFKDGEKISS